MSISCCWEEEPLEVYQTVWGKYWKLRTDNFALLFLCYTTILGGSLIQIYPCVSSLSNRLCKPEMQPSVSFLPWEGMQQISLHQRPPRNRCASEFWWHHKWIRTASHSIRILEGFCLSGCLLDASSASPLPRVLLHKDTGALIPWLLMGCWLPLPFVSSGKACLWLVSPFT